MTTDTGADLPRRIPNAPFHLACADVRKALSIAQAATEEWDDELPKPQAIRDLLIQIHGVGHALRTLAIAVDRDGDEG